MNLEESILQSTQKLPSFPAVVHRAIQLINDPRSTAKDVVEVIQYDQSITVDILKLCNSAYFGLRRNVHSLQEALVIIGFDQLLEIILCHECAQFFYHPCRGYDLDYGALWKHSTASALLSRIISKRLGQETTPTHFTAALIHDIGKVVLSEFVKDYFEEIKQIMEEKGLTFIEAEKEVLGIDHAELGGRIVEQWNFPKEITSCVRYHHCPFSAPEDQEMVHLIYLCDLVAMTTGIGGGADGLSYHAYGEIMRQYQLKEKDIEYFIVQMEDQFQTIEKMLRITF